MGRMAESIGGWGTVTKRSGGEHGWAIALAVLPRSGSPDDVLDLVFDGWDEEYVAGRALLLARLRSFRGGQSRDRLRPIADVLYRTLITFGEESGDMRFVHLAVECRDVLIYGQ